MTIKIPVLVLPPPLLGPLLELLLRGILPPWLRASRRRLLPVNRRRLLLVDRRRLLPVDRRRLLLVDRRRLLLVDRRRLILVDRRHPPLAVRPPKRATLLSTTNTTMNTRFSPRVQWRP